MMNEKETQKVLESFFNDCLKFWEKELSTNHDEDRRPFEKALEDIRRIKHSPYSPYAKEETKLHEETVQNFIKYREIDLGIRKPEPTTPVEHTPSRYMNVDVVELLQKVVNSNTVHFESDFSYDINAFAEAVNSKDEEMKTFIWFSRESGTQCNLERDAFMRNSNAYNVNEFYANKTSENVKAFVVEITGKKDDKIIGNLYEIDQKQYFKENIEKNALKNDHTIMRYEKGETIISGDKIVQAFPHPKLGNFIGYQHEPADHDSLTDCLKASKEKLKKLPIGKFSSYMASQTEHKKAVRASLPKPKDKGANDFNKADKGRESIEHSISAPTPQKSQERASVSRTER